MISRDYDPERDGKAAHRMWRETGWVEKDEQEAAMDTFLTAGRTLVADLNGEAECLVASAPGSMRYLDHEVPLSVVTAVTTSRVARKQGLASRLTAELLARDAAEAAPLAVLGVFDQGFYDRVGFGTGSYIHSVDFDPARLTVPMPERAPLRLTPDDGARAHAAMLARRRGHGGCNVFPPAMLVAEFKWGENGFGLGYADNSGELTHFFWSSAKGEGGPYHISFMAYRTGEQFLELMGVLKSLGDQVRLVSLCEPAGVQFQDILDRPLSLFRRTEKSKYENRIRSAAWWQTRICDLAACLAHTHLVGEPVRFALHLTDPVEGLLAEDAPWRGAAGHYVVTLGHTSSAEPGSDASLPTLDATVNAFSRMWLGVRPASGLATTDQLSGPSELLAALDGILRLPTPSPDWMF